MSPTVFSKAFWQDAAERAISAGAATAVTVPILSGMISDIPWYAILSAFGISAGVDLLRSLASLRVDNGTAGTVSSVISVDRAPEYVDVHDVGPSLKWTADHEVDKDATPPS